MARGTRPASPRSEGLLLIDFARCSATFACRRQYPSLSSRRRATDCGLRGASQKTPRCRCLCRQSHGRITTVGHGDPMPAALGRPCPTPACAHILHGTEPCPTHGHRTARYDRQRGSAWRRGYGHEWRIFRLQVRRRMIQLGIVPVCGAALPGGPLMTDSRCKAEGRLTDGALHLDHDPPLRAEERHDPRTVCDSTRVGWLCGACHAARTRRQQQHGLV